jgi:hypothetical protein
MIMSQGIHFPMMCMWQLESNPSACKVQPDVRFLITESSSGALAKDTSTYDRTKSSIQEKTIADLICNADGKESDTAISERLVKRPQRTSAS